MHTFVRFTATVLAAAPATAQPLTLHVSAATALVVAAGPNTRSIPAGANVTTGAALSERFLDSGISGGTASGELAISVQQRADAIVIDYKATAASAARTFFQGPAASAGGVLRVRLQAPRRTPLSVRLEWCRGLFDCDATADGSVQAAGSTVLLSGGEITPCVQPTPGSRRDVPVVVHPLGTDIDVRLATQASFGGLCFGFGALGSGFWRLTLTADKCDPVPYGSECGARLTVTEDLLEPGMPRFSVLDSTPPAIAVLAVGVQRAMLPLGPCTAYTLPIAVLPLARAGTTASRFEPATGTLFQVQGATLDAAGTVHATQGVELTCR